MSGHVNVTGFPFLHVRAAATADAVVVEDELGVGLAAELGVVVEVA
jgi:hypothetical protein